MSDKTREDFEAWAQRSPVNLTKQHDGMYESSVAAFAFRAYQAATQHSAARIAELEAEVQALRRDAERLAEKAATHDAINRACKELPPGYDLHIELEKDAGIVRLYLPDTDADISDFGSDLGFVGEINAAVDAAIEAERAKP